MLPHVEVFAFLHLTYLGKVLQKDTSLSTTKSTLIVIDPNSSEDLLSLRYCLKASGGCFLGMSLSEVI